MCRRRRTSLLLWLLAAAAASVHAAASLPSTSSLLSADAQQRRQPSELFTTGGSWHDAATSAVRCGQGGLLQAGSYVGARPGLDATPRLGESARGYVARLATANGLLVSSTGGELAWMASIACSHNATSAAVTGACLATNHPGSPHPPGCPWDAAPKGRKPKAAKTLFVFFQFRRAGLRPGRWPLYPGGGLLGNRDAERRRVSDCRAPRLLPGTPVGRGCGHPRCPQP